MYGQSEQALFPFWVPNLYRAIPAAREECVLVHQIPVHREHFSPMLLPASDRELAHSNIEQFYASIASRSEQLIFVLFGPGQIEEAVLGFEELFAYDALSGQVENIQPSIAYETEVRACTYGEARVEEGRVFDAVWVEAGGAELEHLRALGCASVAPGMLCEPRTCPTVSEYT